jgi:hypothetical protein
MSFKSLDPKEIHKMFLASIPKYNIETYYEKPSWTKNVTEFFSNLGKDLGYEARCKEQFGGYYGEFMGLDLVWIKKVEHFIFIDLAMEFENTVDEPDDIINDEFQKLLSIKSFLKILITYPGEGEDELINKIAWKLRSNMLKLNEEKYLIIFGHQGKDKKRMDPWIRFNTYLFDTYGYLIWEDKSGNIPTKELIY